MEKLSKYISKENKINLKKSYMDACSDKDFYNYVKTLPIKEEELMKYTSSLEQCVKERKSCKECHNIEKCSHEVKGYILTPEKTDNRVIFSYIACPKKKEILYKENVTYFDVPKDIKNASLKQVYKDDKGRIPIIKYFSQFIKDYLENKEVKGLYLQGSFGSGKTYLISALLNELAKKNITSTIVYYPEFLRELKSSFGDDYNEKYLTAKNSEILFLDDIGAENCSSWSRDEILGSILQYRMEEHLVTFFTSNLSLSELENHLATTTNGVEKIKARRIIERIKQLTVVMELVSENRRK